mmetsp:Transcript_20011/g.44121  ORF Transcript_20011/g.44121 Transcript_20011/m.44121 type:complete len:114 (-) Transcript_20011:31-372(-)
MVDVTRLVLLDVRVLVRLVLVPMMVAVLPVVATTAVAVVVGVPVVLVKVELLVVEPLVVLVPPSTTTAVTLNDTPSLPDASSAACSVCESDVALVVSKMSTTSAASLPGTHSS